MSDRMALARAFEDAGIERAKAERVASVIFDAIHDEVATKADVELVRTDLKGDIAALRGEVKGDIAALRGELKGDIATLRGEMKTDIAALRGEVKTDIAGLRGNVSLVEHRLITRLGGLMVVLSGLLFAALHYWPPHG